MNFEAGTTNAPRYTSIFKLGNRIQRVRRVLLALAVFARSLIDGQQARNHFNVKSCSVIFFPSFQFFFLFFFLSFFFVGYINSLQRLNRVKFQFTISNDFIEPFRIKPSVDCSISYSYSKKTSRFRRFRAALPLSHLSEC